MKVWQGIGGLIVVGFIVVSAAMASRFGWSLGATETDRWLYAGAGTLADIFKPFLPLLVVAAWHGRQYVRGIAGVLVFVLFSGYSLTSSFGLAAIQRADSIGAHAATVTSYEDLRGELKRLTAERSGLVLTPIADNA